jgi:hypothetical protein
MAQYEFQEIKEPRSDLRKGHLPLIEAIRSAYKPHRIAKSNAHPKYYLIDARQP